MSRPGRGALTAPPGLVAVHRVAWPGSLARSRDPRIQHAAAIFSAACSASSPAASASLRTTHTSAWLRLPAIRSSSSSAATRLHRSDYHVASRGEA